MQDSEPRDLADRDRLGDPPDEAGPDPDVSAERRAESADRARELLAREPGERYRTALRA